MLETSNRRQQTCLVNNDDDNTNSFSCELPKALRYLHKKLHVDQCMRSWDTSTVSTSRVMSLNITTTRSRCLSVPLLNLFFTAEPQVNPRSGCTSESIHAAFSTNKQLWCFSTCGVCARPLVRGAVAIIFLYPSKAATSPDPPYGTSCSGTLSTSACVMAKKGSLAPIRSDWSIPLFNPDCFAQQYKLTRNLKIWNDVVCFT
jgi:hypothetical protein